MPATTGISTVPPATPAFTLTDRLRTDEASDEEVDVGFIRLGEVGGDTYEIEAVDQFVLMKAEEVH